MNTKRVHPRWPDTATGAIECLRHISEFDVPDDAEVTPDPHSTWVWKVEFTQQVKERCRSKKMVTSHVVAIVYLDEEDFECDIRWGK